MVNMIITPDTPMTYAEKRAFVQQFPSRLCLARMVARGKAK